MSAIVLHRVFWSCPDEGRRQEWFTTANKAMAFARRHKISDEAMFSTVVVPRTKAALAEWLNENCRTDNG